MQKRGQVSVFIIIGIVAIAAVIFIFVLFRSFQEKAREITNPQEYLKSQLGDIKKVVVKCISDESTKDLTALSLQGGYFNPIKYVEYSGNKTAFLCYKVKDNEPCVNMMFTRKEVEDQLGPVLQTDIKSCVDSSLESFRNKDYTLTTGEFGFNFVFSDEALLVTLNYPVTLTKGNITQTQNQFVKDTRTGFWKEVELASSIVNAESRGEIIDLVSISSNNLYFAIGRINVAGGNLYMIVPRIQNSGSIFYFAVER